MASVRRRNGSAFWYACITLPGSKQRQFSTGLTDRAEALALAVAAERAARQHAEKPHQLRVALDRLAEEFIPQDDADPGPWLEAWAKSRKGEVADGTAALYQAVMKDAATWFAAEGIRRFSMVTTAVLTRLRDHWAKERAARTVNVRVVILRAGFAAAVRARVISENPAVDVARLRETETRRREFRLAEIDLLLPTLTGEWRGMFLLGLYTGQRISDLAALRWRNVNLAAGTVAFQAKKTGATVALPLLPAVVTALQTLPRGISPDDPVFPAVFALPRQMRSLEFRAKLAAVGLARPVDEAADTARETSELSFHSLRHTATSMLKAAGVSDAIARAIIGHSSPVVSRSYTHLDMETMRQALEKMPAV